MDSLNKILEGILTSSGTDLTLKLVLVVIFLGFSVWYLFKKRDIRNDTAQREEDRDRTQNDRDNATDEQQHSQDGASVRDRLRGRSDDQQ